MSIAQPPLRGDGLRLVLLGYLTLFLELALIRFLPTNVWNLGFFPNFVLISVFVGLGIGFVFHDLLSARVSERAFHFAPIVLLGLLSLVMTFRPRVPGIGGDGGEIGGEVFFSAFATSGSAALYVFPILFPLIALLFALVAQRTAKVFARFRPLTAYTYDIAGSCLGILSFMVVSYFQLPAWVWFVALAPLFVAASAGLVQRGNIVAACAVAGCVALAWNQDRQLLSSDQPVLPQAVVWSPYQKIECVVDADTACDVFVNGIRHQIMLPVDRLTGNLYRLPHDYRSASNQPPYRRVLILGAGSGNDVAAALLNGAEHVDAVEIDPGIARLGRQFHPLHPYDDARVTLILDDGRAFLSRADGPYDLIIFALTDSLVKISPMTQLRLENYLFTEESIARAYELLADDGHLVFYNFYRQQWVIDKIRGMIAKSTGTPPVAEFRVDDLAGLITPKSAVKPATTLATTAPLPDAAIGATDDWPFLYLHEHAIPAVFQVAMFGLVAVITVLLIALRALERRRGDPAIGAAGIFLRAAFLLMGTAFLLLETKGVIQFSLLFGTTWLNNSLVFLSVLVSVLVANWTAMLLPSRRVLPILTALLLASCLVTLVWPLANLLSIEDRTVRFALASLMTFSPIFFANLIFSVSFRDQPAAERLFGWNLLGATLGGVLEYASMVLGYNALSLLVAAIYALVFLALVAAQARTARGPTTVGVD